MDKLQAEIKHSTHIAGLSNDQDKIQLAIRKGKFCERNIIVQFEALDINIHWTMCLYFFIKI